MNVCVCKAKVEQWSAIIDITDQVIEFAPENVKCWYWRAKAYLMIKDYKTSIECFNTVLKLDPKNQAAISE